MEPEANREFIYAAISDTQEIIRTIDSKIEMLLLFLIIPMTGLPGLLAQAKNLWSAHPSCASHGAIAVVLLVFVVTWFLAFYCSFRTLSSISNPSTRIRKPCGARGTFYRGGEYAVGFWDVFVNRSKVVSKSTTQDVVESLPGDDGVLLCELAAEQLKVIYIRDIKIIRQQWAYKFAFAWIIAGMFGQCLVFVLGG